MSGIRSHQDDFAHRVRGEDRAADNSGDRRRADRPAGGLAVACCFFALLAQQAVPASEFDQMVCFRIDQREPASRPQHPRRLGKIPAGGFELTSTGFRRLSRRLCERPARVISCLSFVRQLLWATAPRSVGKHVGWDRSRTLLRMIRYPTSTKIKLFSSVRKNIL
jgi:hypothetical protein